MTTRDEALCELRDIVALELGRRIPEPSDLEARMIAALGELSKLMVKLRDYLDTPERLADYVQVSTQACIGLDCLGIDRTRDTAAMRYASESTALASEALAQMRPAGRA